MAFLSVDKRFWQYVVISAAFIGSQLTSAQMSQESAIAACQTLRAMARIYMAYHHYDKALPLAQQAVAAASRDHAPNDQLALALLDYAQVCLALGNETQAADLAENALALQTAQLGADHPYVAYTLRLLAEIYSRQNRPTQAYDALAQAVRLMLAVADLDSRQMVPFWQTAGILAFNDSQPAAAMGCFQTAVELACRYYGADHFYTAQLRWALAQAAWQAGDLSQAQREIDLAAATYTRYRRQMPDQWQQLLQNAAHIHAHFLHIQALRAAQIDNG